MRACQVYIEGISLLGPGFNSWAQAMPILRGELAWQATNIHLPVVDILPPAERRRAGIAIKLSLAVGQAAVSAAGADAKTLPNVFSSTAGDCVNCHEILDVLAQPGRMISPTRFHNSVHNAPAGYWGIATHCSEASTSLCTFDATFSAGLLEAATQALSTSQPCLMVAFDTAYPEPLYKLRPIPYSFGLGMVLSPVKTARSIAAISLSFSHQAISTMEDKQLELLRSTVPSARCLPMMQLLSTGQSARVVVDYLDQTNFAIDVVPC